MLPATADASGYCDECLKSTGRSATTPEGREQPTPAASVAFSGPTQFAATGTYVPSPDTRSDSQSSAPTPPPPRADRLRAAGWVDVRRLTHGGMGELFVGYDPALQKQVVAKFILADALTPTMRERFAVEATALARFSHPNVARLFAVSGGDDPFIVMEFVDGGSLADRLRKSPLSPSEAAEVLEAVARGIAAAHANGLIHRDLKPSNILLDCSGPAAVAKVTDFGMAKDADAVAPLTGSNAALGTPEYMSPEQAARNSGACDARSDVWGLAATLYAAVTGRAPYTRDLSNPPVLTEPLTPPETFAPSVPAELAAVITMGLEKHPDDRYQTAEEFADDLKRFRNGEPVRARRRPWAVRAWRRARRVPKATAVPALVALIALAGLGAAWLSGEATPEQKLARLLADLAAGKPVTLVGPTGPPVWHEAARGTYALGVSPHAEGACVIESVRSGVCLLLPQVPCASYRIDLEMADVGATANQPAKQALHSFGVLAGVARESHGETAFTHGFGLLYEDADPRRDLKPPPIPARARCLYQAWIDRPRNVPYEADSVVDATAFPASRTIGTVGIFREIRLAVSPDGVRVFWPGDPAVAEGRAVAQTAAEVTGRVSAVSEYARPAAPEWPGPLAAWDPTRPFGIVVNQAIVAIRNVRVTPN